MITTFTPNFNLKQYDTERTLYFTCSIDSTTIDLSAATASLLIQKPDGTVLTRTPVVVTAASGSVYYDLVSGDTDMTGLHRLEMKIKYNDESVLRLPSTSYIYMMINPAING